MESLTERLADGPPSRERVCGIEKWVRKLPDEDEAMLRDAMDLQSEWTNSEALHKVLKEYGLKLNADALRKHRRKGCPCYA